MSLEMARTPFDPTTASTERLRARLSKQMLETVVRHNLIEDGDKILVAVSGGKDSYTMLDLMDRAREKAPVDFELRAWHLDQQQPGYDGSMLRTWLEARGIPFEMHSEDTYSAVIAATEPGRSYCRICSRLRRGILYAAAARAGCNKIALGHHREDSLETLWLNMFYAGKLQAMPPGYETNDGRFRVIRPLVECDEISIENYARREEFPILPCNLCGSQDGLKRDEVRRWLADLEKRIPNVRSVMMASLANVRPSHLLDREVLEAWEAAADRFPPRQ